MKHQLLLSSKPAALWPSAIPLAFMVLRSSDSALNYTISVLAWAATAKYHRLGGLNNKSIFLTVLEAAESKIKVLTNVTPS